MCGRYTNETEFSHIRLLFEAADRTFRAWTPKYNISPTSTAGYEQLIVTADRPGTRQIRLARFWLIPADWRRPLSQLPTTFNARSEDLAERRTWQGPFEHSRCLVPATGWREFVGEKSPKQPFHFRPLASAAVTRTTRASILDAASSEAQGASGTFAFAGLRSTWTSPDGELVDSFAIVTTAPSVAASRIHDRMPLVLPTELHQHWLESDDARHEIVAQARAFNLNLELDIFPTDPIASSSRYEGPAAIRRYEPTRTSRQLSLLDPEEPTRRRS